MKNFYCRFMAEMLLKLLISSYRLVLQPTMNLFIKIYLSRIRNETKKKYKTTPYSQSYC